MADEAVIRVVVQGSKGTSSGAEGAVRSDPDLQRSIAASEKNTAQSEALTRATVDTSASLARLERKLSEPARGGGTSGIAGKVMSGILDALAKTASSVLSLPMDLVKDYNRAIYYEFSKSLVKGLGGDAFGKQLGNRFADMIRGVFTNKEGGEMGRDAANIVADRIKWVSDKVKDWFKKKPPGDGGAGPGDGGDGGPPEPPPPPPLVPAGGREGDAKWFKKEYKGLIETFGDKHAAERKEWNDKRLRELDKSEGSAIEMTEAKYGVGGGPDIEEFARGGKIGKTGLAYVHEDETIVPIAERAGPVEDQSGPGEATSDLDDMYDALGMGKALREIPDEIAYVINSKIGGKIPNVGPVHHKSIAIGPGDEPPVLPDGSLNPKFKSYGHAAGSSTFEEEKEQRKGINSAQKIDADVDDVRRAMAEFNKEYKLFGENCQHAADDVAKAARSFGGPGADLPEAEAIETPFKSFKPDKWLDGTKAGRALRKYRGMSPKDRKRARGRATLRGLDRGGRGSGRAAAKAARLAGRGAARALPKIGKAAGKAVVGSGGFAKGFVQGAFDEAPVGSAVATAGLAAAGGVGIAMMAADALGKVARGGLGILTTYKNVITDPDTSVTKPIKAFGDLISKAGEKIPLIGMAGEAISAFGHVIDNVTKTAEKYGEYSPEISSALAIAEIRQQLGDVERANRIQNEMSEFVMARSDLQAKWEETKIHLLQEALPPLVTLMAFTGKILDKINEYLGIENMPEYNIKDPVDYLLNDPKYGQEFNEITGRGGYVPGDDGSRR